MTRVATNLCRREWRWVRCEQQLEQHLGTGQQLEAASIAPGKVCPVQGESLHMPWYLGSDVQGPSPCPLPATPLSGIRVQASPDHPGSWMPSPIPPAGEGPMLIPLQGPLPSPPQPPLRVQTSLDHGSWMTLPWLARCPTACSHGPLMALCPYTTHGPLPPYHYLPWPMHIGSLIMDPGS